MADDTQLREGPVLTGTAEANNLEWVTPGHPLFKALRRHGYDSGQDAFARAACFRSLAHDEPARVDSYGARAVDGLGQVIHERLFAVESRAGSTPPLRGRGVLADMTPAPVPNGLPAVARLPEETAWLNEHALVPFVEEVRFDRRAEVGRVAEHVELSLTEILQRLDEDIGRAADEVAGGAEGRLALAERRHAEVLTRRERRREELERQRAVTLLRVNGRPRMMRPPTRGSASGAEFFGDTFMGEHETDKATSGRNLDGKRAGRSARPSAGSRPDAVPMAPSWSSATCGISAARASILSIPGRLHQN